MAPKRSVKISPTSEKTPTTPGKSRGRPKTAKILKVPSNITISIPVSGIDVPDNEKHVTMTTKIALANEVARSQLSRETIAPRFKTPPAPKRGRKKSEIVSKFFANNNTPNGAKGNKAKKDSPAIKKVIKKPVQAPITKRVVSRKRKADSTEQKSNIKRKQSKGIDVSKEQIVLKVEPLDSNIKSKDNIKVIDTENQFDEKLFETPMVVIPRRRMKLCKGKSNSNVSQRKKLQRPKSDTKVPKPQANRKKQSTDSLGCHSPILKASSMIKPTQKAVKVSNKHQVDTRKVSPTSSISNLSWTHDISSTTTCITASCKDYVCFDSKMPIVKLNNINCEINKTHPNDNNENESSDDSSSSDNETSCDQSKSLSNSNSFVKVDPINLSCSSQSSDIIRQESHKNNSNKQYARASENLLRALEKIDMEFINWTHEPEYVSSDLNKLKDKLYHILNSEFSIFTHCRNLHEILKTARSDHKADDGSNNKHKPDVGVESINANSEKYQNRLPDINSMSPKKKLRDPIPMQDITNRNETEMCETDNSRHSEIVETECDLTKPSTSGVVSDKFTYRDILSESENSSDNEDLLANVHVRSFSPHNPHDDDDALSLFAESITGIESSKLNASTVSANNEKRAEEYVPEPVQKKCVSPNYTYCPTIIADHIQNGTIKTVCEKQNADSTSVYRVTDNNSIHKDSNNRVEAGHSDQDLERNYLRNVHSEASTPKNLKKTFLLADLFKLEPKHKNIIFKRYCYFNIIQKCSGAMYNQPCRYSHYIPDEYEIKDKLCMLDEELFIKEYMLARRNDHVMRRYGLCFVQECAERQLTRVLVEMALDFVMKGPLIDNALKVNAVEIALLHLNNVDLSECEDLLKIRVCDGQLLCDIFMRDMSRSQNFSRFKPVFLSLTYFLVKNGRTFSLEIAEQILERVCILPFDEPVVRALIQILRLTNPKIFLNSKIVQFEKEISAHSDVFEEYASVKRDINFENIGRRVDIVSMMVPVEPRQFQPMASPVLIQTEDQTLTEIREGAPLPPSPDTTHLDIMNKTTEDTMMPKIIRTISGLNSTPKLHGISPSSSISEEVQQQPPKHRNWRHKSIFKQLDKRFSPRGRQISSPLQMRSSNHHFRRFDHRLVTLGGSSSKYLPPRPKY